MTGKTPKEAASEWAYFAVFLVLSPLIILGSVFAVIGGGLFKLLVADRYDKLPDKRPELFVNLAYAFIGGAILIGFALMIGVGQ